MAEPPHGYGPYLYHPAATYPAPSGPPNNPSPYYSPAPTGAIPPTTYTTSQVAYDYNSNRIPGLGLGDPPMASSSLPPSASPVWHDQGHTSQVSNQFSNQYQAPGSFTKPQPLPHHRNDTLEEGELSEGEGEGELEDIYEPRHSTNASQATPHVLAHNAGSRDGSAGDADGSSIYDPRDSQGSKDENPQAASSKAQGRVEQSLPDDEWEPSYLDRERSGSYSPYLSPREVHRRISVAKTAPSNDKPNDRVEASRPPRQLGAATVSTPSTTAPRANGTIAAPKVNNSNVTSTSISQDESSASGAVPFRSPSEAKKKVQEAILGLWPLKVRYQDYIEEGVDESIVQALFKDLGLDIPVTKPASAPTNTGHEPQAETAKTIEPSKAPTEPASQPHDKAIPPPSTNGQRDDKEKTNKGGGPTHGEKSAAEERKDKIARKLAAMAQKTTVAQPPGPSALVSKLATVPASVPVPASDPVPSAMSVQSPAPSSAPPPTQAAVSKTPKPDVTPTPQAVGKTKAENTAILQQKLAKLKKQQAQLAAEKAKAASNASTTSSSPAPAESNPEGINRSGDLTPKPTSAAPPGQPLNQPRSPAEPHDNHKNQSVPSLLLQSKTFPQPTQSSSRSLKRPVASDFDNYTPPTSTLKRSRTDERLVIDVSDDEDVEMDMGSPTDEAGQPADSSTAPRSSLGAFAPLSDGPHRRQQPSPASNSAATPVKGARIDLLHKRIEETKRMIAEAEAKKAAKKGTPQQSPGPSSPAAQQPLSLPKFNKSNVEAKNNITSRRDRIASFELPRVNAALKEKQDKLKQIVAEAARLELEVQASMEEERKLRAEMEQLEVPIDNTPSLEEQSPKPSQATARSPIAEQHTSSDAQQSSPKGSSSTLKPLQTSDSTSTDADEEMDVDSNYDEALQTSMLNDRAHSSNDQIATAAASVATNGTSTPNISHSSMEANGQTQPSATDVDKVTEQAPGEAVVDVSVELSEPLAVSGVPTGSAVPSEPDVPSSESDISMQQSAAESSQSDDEYEPIPAQIHDSPHNQGDEQQSTEAFDDVPEEPSPNHTLPEEQKALEPEKASHEDDQGSTSLIGDLLSYKSPLLYFRAYKFHPNYFKDVPGGLKSMTFNARVDPMRAVCPLVLAGEPCPKGSNCEYQHFDSMVLSEAEIITQLGSADMFTGETKTKFIEGLKRVLNDLKANRIKDFDRITKAIVKHRQEFLGDRSKVLALDGSTA